MHLIGKDEEYEKTEKRTRKFQTQCAMTFSHTDFVSLGRRTKGVEKGQRRAGRKAGGNTGGWGGGWTPGRKMTDRIQVGDDEGRSHGGNRRSQGRSVGGRRQGEDRRCQEGPRLQRWWRPTEEPTEGGAMVEEGLTTPGGPPTAAKQKQSPKKAEKPPKKSPAELPTVFDKHQGPISHLWIYKKKSIQNSVFKPFLSTPEHHKVTLYFGVICIHIISEMLESI